MTSLWENSNRFLVNWYGKEYQKLLTIPVFIPPKIIQRSQYWQLRQEVLIWIQLLLLWLWDLKESSVFSITKGRLVPMEFIISELKWKEFFNGWSLMTIYLYLKILWGLFYVGQSIARSGSCWFSKLGPKFVALTAVFKVRIASHSSMLFQQDLVSLSSCTHLFMKTKIQCNRSQNVSVQIMQSVWPQQIIQNTNSKHNMTMQYIDIEVEW